MDSNKSSQKPDYKDAELTLKLYELRREPVMRESRTTMTFKFFPKSWDEFIAVTKPDHPMNAAFRQISSFWEMVYGMAHHGIAHPEYLVETNAEGLFLFAKVQPYLARYREELGNPSAFHHAEWAATQTEVGRTRLEFFKRRIAALQR